MDYNRSSASAVVMAPRTHEQRVAEAAAIRAATGAAAAALAVVAPAAPETTREYIAVAAAETARARANAASPSAPAAPEAPLAFAVAAVAATARRLASAAAPSAPAVPTIPLGNLASAAAASARARAGERRERRASGARSVPAPRTSTVDEDAALARRLQEEENQIRRPNTEAIAMLASLGIDVDEALGLALNSDPDLAFEASGLARRMQMAVQMQGEMSYDQLLALEDNVGTVDVGLSEHILEQLPRRRYEARGCTEAPNCAVCLDEFDAGADIITLPCMHEFHGSCICEWLKKKPTCPCCVQDVRTAFSSDPFMSEVQMRVPGAPMSEVPSFI